MQRIKNVIHKVNIKYLLPIVPILILGIYLYGHIVNVPFWDQWEIVPILEHVKSGHIYFNDFWQQHNEHRLLFPRVLMVGSAVLTHWDLRAEIWISFVLAILSFGLLLKSVSQLERKKDFRVPLLLPLILGGIWFSLLQYENWLWGWQIQWYLNVLALMVVMYAVSKIIDKPNYYYLALAITGTFIAQYSLGNGVLIWPLLVIALVYLKVGYKKISISVVAAILSTAAYYSHYKDPKGPSKTLILEKPIEYVKYVSAYLGRPLSYQPRVAAIAGFLMALGFIVLCVYLYIKKPDRFRKLLPFVLIGLYAIASGLITGLSRLGLGLEQSVSSRYTTMSSLLLVSVVVIVVYNRDIFKTKFKKAYIPIAYTLTALLIFAISLNMNWGRIKADEKTQYLKDIKSCTSAQQPYEICFLSTYPNKKVVSPRLEYLKIIKWGGY